LREEAAFLDFDHVRTRSSQGGEWIGHVMDKKGTRGIISV
jgi:hypothetical protein